MRTYREPYLPAWHAATIALAAFALAASFCLPAFPATQSAASDEGNIKLSYASELANLSDSNTLYSLADAHFGIYSDYQCTQRAGELVTDEDGHATSTPLPAGRYFIKEELASPGFALSTQLYQVDVAIGASATVETSATPDFSAPEVIIREINAETGNPAGVAGARLGGATYTVSHYDSFDDDNIIAGPTRSWTFKSDENGEVRLSEDCLVTGSPLYTGPHGLPVMPLGHYTITVDQSPAGFVAVNTVLNRDVVEPPRNDTEPSREFEPLDETLRPIRGDFMFRKTDENGIALAGIPFLLSYADADGAAHVESHVIVTDEYGDYTSSAEGTAHSMRTNANDDAIIACVDGTYELDDSKLSDDAGTWFSVDANGSRAAVDDTRGALPYGSYILQELPCDANRGMNLVATQFNVNRDAFTVKLDNIVNTRPAITGSASDTDDGDGLVRPSGNVSVDEKVAYRNLVVGKSYRINCTALVQSTGENVPGPQGTPALASLEFTPEQSSGTLSLHVTLDCSALAGERIVMQLELVDGKGMSITGDDEDGTDQTLDVEPVIIATACDASDGDAYVMGSEAIVREHLSYDGLRSDRSYMASCILNDKATGNALRDAQGKVITAHVEFVPESSRGSVELDLGVDTSAIAGHDIVVFDKLTDENGNVIANHRDIEDAAQTVKTVKLTSNATDKADGDKIFDANARGVTIVDTVSYANLVPGEQYVLKGALMDRETGCALNTGDGPVSAEVPFVPQEISGSVDVEYGFDASAQSSQVLVAFETLEHDGNVIAEHADLEDVAQTVTSGEVDPDALSGGQATSGGSSGKGPSVLTGDFWTRVLLMSLVTILGACACIAYATHRHRRTLESIAHSDDPFR